MSDYLIHWGIPGQKKGNRRFQYKDGSLTPEGRVRYGVGPARESNGTNAASSVSNTSNANSSKQSAASVEFKKPEASSTEPHKETAEEHRAKVQRAIKSGNKDEVKKYALDMTSDELRKAMDKVDLMQKLNASEPPKTAFDRIDNVANTLNKLSNYYTTATNTWNNFARAYNSLNKDGNDLKLIGQDNSGIKTAEQKLRAARNRQVIQSGNAALIQKYANEMSGTELSEATKRLQNLDAIAKKNYSKVGSD
jgi:hypothetical protein